MHQGKRLRDVVANLSLVIAFLSNENEKHWLAAASEERRHEASNSFTG
ncbi:hypothetical protein LZ017_01245 [Pelomonas sp. CA6]|nr:hypothetical protein [Pelomonas sp. CA6]MCH7342011.1 hypothetical protein [Pelomonas sp. CA6]